MNKNLLAMSVCAALISGCGGGESDSEVVLLDDGSGSVGAVNTPIDASPVTPIVDNSPIEEETAPDVSPQDDITDDSTIGTAEPVDEDTDSEQQIDPEPLPTNNADDNQEPSPELIPEPTDSDADNAPEEDATVSITPPSGLLDTARPVFSWPAVSGAEMYKIVVKDADGNGYARSLDPLAANCQTGEGACDAATGMGYYDNDLTWFVESTVNGAPGPTSDAYSITTPISENIMPIKSNVSDCEAWASVAYGKYVVLNNSWNSRAMNNPNWSQLINVTENANGSITPAWSYDWLGQFDGGEIDVKAYPEVLYGPKLGTHVSGSKEETGLPEKVSDLPEFVVTYDYSETGNAERNVAIESFFHDSDDIRGPCDDVDNRVYEMMIWVNNPSIRTPGKLALTGVMVDNQLWNVYIKPDSNKHYIAFTAQNPTTRGTLNWKRFVEWTSNWTAANAEERQIDVLNTDYYMGAIEIGTEMWWGEGTFTLNEFNVTF